MTMLWWLLVAMAAPIEPDVVVDAALRLSPEVAVAEANVDRAEAYLSAERGLRFNPTLDVRLGFGLPQHEVALSQPVSLSGEGLAAAASAEAGVRAARATATRTRFIVAAEARRTLVTAIVAQATLGTAEDLLTLTVTLRTATEARLQAGEASDLDVQLARLDEAAATADVIAATQAVQAARSALAKLTGLPWDIELPLRPEAALPAEVPATRTRADVIATNAAEQAARYELRRARAAILPPVQIGIWAQAQNVGVYAEAGGVVIPRSAGNTAWTVGPSLTVTLPVFKANPGGRGEGAAGVEVAAAEARSTAVRAVAEAAQAAEQRALIARVRAMPDPTGEAQAALAGVTQAVTTGELSPGEATVLRARVLETWRRSVAARTSALDTTLDLALAEEWTTLLPSGSW